VHDRSCITLRRDAKHFQSSSRLLVLEAFGDSPDPVKPHLHLVIASNVAIELRTNMAQAIDSSSAPVKSLSTFSGIHALTGAAMRSPNDDQTVDRCEQDLDLSHASTVSHIEDCNLECCSCAVRWSARRAMLQREA
jgi:hypothetical protein